ncbi:MAG: hypothetical protein RSD40_00450 [Bacilli bacterium]
MSDIVKIKMPESNYKIDLELQKEKIYAEITADRDFFEKLLKFGLTDIDIKNNIIKIQDYYDESKICKNCKGIGHCSLGNKFFKRIPISNNGVLDFVYEYCDLYAFKEKENSLIISADYDPSYNEKSWTDIDVNSVRNPLVLALTNKIVKNSGDDFYFIEAPSHQGGTFITSVFFKSYILKYNLTGIYLDAFLRISELNDLIFSNKNKFNELFNKYINVDVLVLNKISSCYFSDFIRDNILFPLINERIRTHKMTIVISEISLDNFVKLMVTKSSASGVRAQQIKSLFANNYSFYNISSNIKIY